MRIFIWNKVFEISFEEEEDIEYNRLSESQLAQVKELINREKAAAKSDYLARPAQPEKDSPADFSDISERDRKNIKAFIQLLETDKGITWPEFRHPDLQEEPEEMVAYEGEVWDFIDVFVNSTICRFDYSDKPLQINEILAFMQCTELLDTLGKNTMRALFTDIMRYDSPSISKQHSCGFLGELATKKQLIPFLEKLL